MGKPPPAGTNRLADSGGTGLGDRRLGLAERRIGDQTGCVHYSRVPMLLTTHDAAELRAVPQRAWLHRLSRWALFIGGLTAFAVMVSTTPEQACNVASPCYPLPYTSMLIGFFAIMPFLAFLHLGFAAAAASVLAAALIWHDAVVPSMAAPAWVHAAIIGYAAFAALLFWLNRQASRSDVVSQWEIRQERSPVPVAGPGIRRLRRWSVLGALLMVAGVGCAAWSLILQRDMDQRQAAARVVSATVVEVNDEDVTVVAILPDGQRVTVDVWDTAPYRLGSEHMLAVDDEGLRQPITEPYDATPWLAAAVILVGLGAAGQQRRYSRLRGRATLFGQPQPATAVWTRPGDNGDLLIYARDTAPHEAPLWSLQVHQRYVPYKEPADDSEDDSEDDSQDWYDEIADDEYEVADPGPLPVQSATLYGTPLTGRWCTVVMDAQSFSPKAPLRPATDRTPLQPVPTPPLPGRSVPDPGRPQYRPQSPYEAAPPPPKERPLTPAETAALSIEDYAPEPRRLHVARVPVWIGYGLTLATPLAAAPLYQKLPGWVSPAWVYTIVAAIAAVAMWFGWRVWIRPRVAWNGGGVSVRGLLGARVRVLEWSQVRELTYDEQGLVSVTTVDSQTLSVAIPKSSRPSAQQLWLRLRNARLRADPAIPAPHGAIAGGRFERLVVLVLWPAWTVAIANTAIWGYHWVST